MSDFAVARALLTRAIADRVTPAAVLEVGHRDRVLHRSAHGAFTYAPGAPACSEDSIFDLASLTKIIATATTAMRLVETGAISLDAPAIGGATVRDLLEHASGLPAHVPLYRHFSGRAEYHTAIRDEFRRAILETPLAYPPRTTSVYSDLGFMLLGFLLEDAGEAPLDVQFERVRAELQGTLTFLPGEELRDRILPTEVDDARGEVRGVVHDENAHALGGVAAHAGLFGDAHGCGSFARAILSTFAADTWLAKRDTLELFTTRSSVHGSSRALAWDTMLTSSSCGTQMSARAIGHTGFTGTSLWIDPGQDIYVVLLTNRVHPSRNGEGIQPLRRAVHDAVMSE